MVILIVALALGVVLLVLLSSLVWYARQIHAGQARLLAFLDAWDLDQRRQRADALVRGEGRQSAIQAFFRDTRALLGKLLVIAEELSPHQRDTFDMQPPPSAESGDRVSDSDLETQCFEGPVHIPFAARPGDRAQSGIVASRGGRGLLNRPEGGA